MRGNDALYTGDVRIEGDVGLGQTLKEILGSIDPDWQEAISPVLGDALTHRLDQMHSRLREWLTRTRDNFEQNTSDYLQEEIELLAPNSQVHRFCKEVDECRAHLDRLQARLSILESAKSVERSGDGSC